MGKTTLARIIANQTKANFINFSAVTSGIKDIRTVMKKAQEVQDMGEKTIVFVDEIHRFNKAQQDAFFALCRTRQYNFNWSYNRESFI